MCKRTIRRHKPTREQPRDPHSEVCGLMKCKFCKEDVPLDHMCTVQPIVAEDVNPPDGVFKEVIWDSETVSYSFKKVNCLCTYINYAVSFYFSTLMLKVGTMSI